MVALLVQEEMMAYEYRVRAVAGPPQHVAPGETVSTDQPLLTASTAHQPVTVHALDEDRRSDLFAYDANGSEVTCRALAPLRQHTSPDLSFLLVDAHADLDTSRARTMLEQFADTMALVLDANAHPALDVHASPTDDSSWDEDWSEDDVVGRDSPVADASRVPSDRPPPHDPEPDADVDNRPADEEEASPRPRREIIVEEMKVAYDDNLPLSLVLVHLNRAESLSETDTETVDACERHLRDYLQECAPESRVTRFGELTYGVFVNAPIDAVETWALELDAAFDRQEGLLRGGASIGVAVWNKEDDPDTLRANATEALREAYMSGYCTLID